MKNIFQFLFGILTSVGNCFVELSKILRGLFLDKHHFVDEKKIFGAAFLVGALIYPFVGFFEPLNLLVLLAIGVALYLGVPIADKIQPLQNLPGLGLFDLITNKANEGDPARLFGTTFLIIALIYPYSPLWVSSLNTHWEYLALLGLTGLSLLGVAIYGDKVATQEAPK